MGVQLRPAESLLAARAFDYLCAGPSEVAPLISAVCQQPRTPAFVAEHLAMTLLGQDARFHRLDDGRWAIRERNASYEVTRAVPAPTSLKSLTYVVVDVETTGGSVFHGHRMTEIGAVVVRNGKVLEDERFERIVNPLRAIPPFISRLTNISYDMVRNQPSFAGICDELVDFLEGKIFVAHNVSYDWRFVGGEISRVSGRRLEGRRLCTVKLARRLLPQLARRSLANVARHYGIEMTRHEPHLPGRHRGRDDALVAHTAAGDAVATAHVLLGLLNDAEERGCTTWDDLESLCIARTGAARRQRARRSGLPRPVERDGSA